MQRLPPYVFRTFLSRFLENSAFGIVYKYIFMQSFFHSKFPVFGKNIGKTRRFLVGLPLTDEVVPAIV